MTVVVILLFVGAAVAFVLIARGGSSRRASNTSTVTLRDIPRIFERLANAGHDGAFAVLLFGRNGEPPSEVDALNVQFSMEDGRAGFDWVLLAPMNLAEERRVVAFFQQEGSPLSLRSMNGVDYLRTERGNLAELCQRLLGEVFAVTEEQELDLTAEGFDPG